ncbi:hypothetical protein [Paenibacillus puerhi]|uniref:hypothetical protein n=1 Tax=Paenibacillus puerhi TaxID=2692622 RepID=UPI001915A5AD|nr:hypothetical protein [Paenibacillus puerhi]
MNEAKAAAWSKTRQMGKAKFIMIRGVLLWGVTLAAVFTAIEWFSQQTVLSSWLTVRLLVFGIVGFFAANFQWDGNERKYEAYQRQLQASAGSSKKGKRKPGSN